MVTITDVSQLAKVSKATVSRVLSGSRGVKEESREAVLKAADALNYRPNAMAQSLASRRSDYIGVVLSSLTTQVAGYLPLIAKALKQRNKQMLVSFADSAQEYIQAIETFNSNQCDAIIALGGSVPPEYLDNVIAINSQSSESLAVDYDYQFASESACRYLSRKGHSSIALMLENNQYTAQQVMAGYKTAMQNLSIPINRQLIVNVESKPELAVMNLLNSYSPFTALVVMKDSHAAIAMKLFRDFNLSTPQEVSIMSLEDSPLASQLVPALTCIRCPVEHMVDLAVQQLDKHLTKQPVNDSVSVQGNLVVRDSVVDHR